jgi:acyloxyacyl hydrolase
LEWINRFVNEHEPLFDLDADKFSDWYAFRGTAWRGKDCDDIRANIYPGRRNSTYNVEQDQDCNGISGKAENGTSWEELYCSGTPRYGQVILGDSAAAHFHIPLAWAAPMEMTITSFDDLIPILANELDWPEMSSTTGFTESTWQGHPNGPVSSSYLKSIEQNRCAFRGLLRSEKISPEFEFYLYITNYTVLISGFNFRLSKYWS